MHWIMQVSSVLLVLLRVDNAAVDVSERRNPKTSSCIRILAQRVPCTVTWLRCWDSLRVSEFILKKFAAIRSRASIAKNAWCGLRIEFARKSCTHCERQGWIDYCCDQNKVAQTFSSGASHRDQLCSKFLETHHCRSFVPERDECMSWIVRLLKFEHYRGLKSDKSEKIRPECLKSVFEETKWIVTRWAAQHSLAPRLSHLLRSLWTCRILVGSFLNSAADFFCCNARSMTRILISKQWSVADHANQLGPP